MAQRYIQIYKDIITKLWSLEQFTGDDAKFIDSFSMSSLETITPISWDLESSTYSQDIIGNKRAKEALNESYDTDDCIPGHFFNSPFGGSLGLLQDNLVAYVFH